MEKSPGWTGLNSHSIYVAPIAAIRSLHLDLLHNLVGLTMVPRPPESSRCASLANLTNYILHIYSNEEAGLLALSMG